MLGRCKQCKQRPCVCATLYPLNARFKLPKGTRIERRYRSNNRPDDQPLWKVFITTKDAYYSLEEFLEGKSKILAPREGEMEKTKNQPHYHGRCWINIDDPIFDRIAMDWDDLERVL